MHDPVLTVKQTQEENKCGKEAEEKQDAEK